jgi:5-formyltetrahydrofolate cyclo-ligase
MKDIQSLKCCLRSEGREFRSRLVPEKKLSFDRSIHRHFLALKEYRLADTVFTYVSIKREIDTFAIISAALAQKGCCAALHTGNFHNEIL